MLVLYLAASGLDPVAIGAVLTLTLIGDTLVSLWLTTHADRLGRRRVLIFSSLLVVVAGVVFAFTDWLPLLILAGIVGVISPTGNEVGPFPRWNRRLTQIVPDRRRTATLPGTTWSAISRPRQALWPPVCWASADGRRLARRRCLSGRRRRLRRDRSVYGSVGDASPADHRDPALGSFSRQRRDREAVGLGRSRSVVLRLSALFSLDAFAGGFIPQSLMAYWFALRFGVSPATLGAIFFAANILAAVSSLSAARIAARIGLIETMVYTHLPSNILLILVPLMPTLPLPSSCCCSGSP